MSNWPLNLSIQAFGSLQRRVAGAGGVVDEEGLFGRERFFGLDPGDGLVGQVFVEGVVGLAAGWREHLDGLGAQGELRMPLVRLAVEEAVVVVEALLRGPVVEWAGGRSFVLRDQVPLTEVPRWRSRCREGLQRRGRRSWGWRSCSRDSQCSNW